MFVTSDPVMGRVVSHMGSETVDSTAIERAVAERTDAPTGGETESLDVRELGPPEPLRKTLERIEALPEEGVLLQYNDRSPKFLFPRLDERGFAYAAVETDATDAVVTAIWPDGSEGVES
ncbi:DUF2249 domain-containing protein [Halorubrum sp. SD626R]|uniref:DUF2249 domain-containing protein n=1 Tax=Halorubrum TaxID=56688 RepID=UPI0010F724DF|nr:MULTISPECIES: DUF2249 domain-containing protein [Halorubrum]TKX79106.1 DUF2249 domain-containing protein [Halorubrum sp. SD626R]